MHIDSSRSNGPGMYNNALNSVGNGLNDVRSEDGDLAFFAVEGSIGGIGDLETGSKRQEELLDA